MEGRERGGERWSWWRRELTTPLWVRPQELQNTGELLERLFESGRLASHREAAELLGVTERRISQLVTMTMLAPRIQEAILDGTLEIDGRTVRKVALKRVWEEQEAGWIR